MKPNTKNSVLIEGYPAPPALPLRPFAALQAVTRLVRNKEDTTQVFEISNALSRGSHNKLFARFVRSAYGRRVVEDNIKMENILGNFDKLRTMPEGSFGRSYLEFMESGELTPEGLINVAEDSGIAMRDSEYEAYSRVFMHMETTHDVWHVLTGYNRDALGELCLLEVSSVLTYNKAFLLITGIGGLVMKKQNRSLPIWAIRKEALRIGKAMNWLPEIDFEALLTLPLEKVRAKLNIETPIKYNAVPQSIKDELLKPVTAPANDSLHEQAAE